MYAPRHTTDRPDAIPVSLLLTRPLIPRRPLLRRVATRVALATAGPLNMPWLASYAAAAVVFGYAIYLSALAAST